MDERFCRVGDVELCYETFGEENRPALLLIMGLGTQMVAWHDDLCRELAGRGFRVIRFDNRDTGRSSRIDAPPPTTWQIVRRSRTAAAYDLADMANDAAGLLDHLGIESAHVAGASMGGMIAQTLAARHPARVRSLASIMSSTGSRWSGQPSFRVVWVLMAKPPRDRDAFIEHSVRVFTAIGSRGLPRDDERIREIAALSYERGHDPAGSGRQLAAIFASGDRTAELRRITAPAVVIHGTADRLVRPSGGRATARAIPGARLVTVKGMGHDLPRAVWPQIVEAIVSNAERAAQPAAASG